jgi:hypothetical protein
MYWATQNLHTHILKNSKIWSKLKNSKTCKKNCNKSTWMGPIAEILNFIALLVFSYRNSFTHKKFLCSKSLLSWNRACVAKYCVAATQIFVIFTQVFVWWPVFLYKVCLFATQKFQHRLGFNTRAILNTRVLRVYEFF